MEDGIGVSSAAGTSVLLGAVFGNLEMISTKTNRKITPGINNKINLGCLIGVG